MCSFIVNLCVIGYLLAMCFWVCFVECSDFEFADILVFVVWAVAGLISLRFCWGCFVLMVGWGRCYLVGCVLYLVLLVGWFLLFTGG